MESQRLTIGAQQGRFPGMLTNRTFRGVWVSSGHGAGIPASTMADRLVSYNGNAVEVQP